MKPSSGSSSRWSTDGDGSAFSGGGSTSAGGSGETLSVSNDPPVARFAVGILLLAIRPRTDAEAFRGASGKDADETPFPGSVSPGSDAPTWGAELATDRAGDGDGDGGRDEPTAAGTSDVGRRL